MRDPGAQVSRVVNATFLLQGLAASPSSAERVCNSRWGYKIEWHEIGEHSFKSCPTVFNESFPCGIWSTDCVLLVSAPSL